MKTTTLALSCCLIAAPTATTAIAQDEATLKQHFEGKMVRVKIDMPATERGIDVFPEKQPAINFEEYGRRLKQHGVAVPRNDDIMITKIRAKKKHIEFQVGGGGYGTFWDETGDVYAPSVGKSKREKELEKAIKAEPNASRKRIYQAELDALKQEREKEQRRLSLDAEQAEQSKKSRIADKALRAGSRFNIRYKNKLGWQQLTAKSVMAALAEYVVFDSRQGARVTADASPAAISTSRNEARAGGNATLKKGMSWAEVAKIMGAPTAMKKQVAGGMEIMSYSFEKNGKTIEARFVENLLVSFSSK